jgi:peptidoglycan/xylan/chitin deacetylase (PgdA/CDA1 family)
MELLNHKVVKILYKFFPKNLRNFGLILIVKTQRVVKHIFLFLLFRRPKKTALDRIEGGGIILTFDDHHISDWFEADRVLKEFHWKATFNISNLSSLSPNDFEMLKILQTNGHEIALHGYSHLDAVKFISNKPITEYIETEILPALRIMRDNELNVNSFAYPFGERKNEIDNSLLNYFAILRGTTYGKKPPSIQNSYANGTRVVFGLGIDKHYGNDVDYILEILDYVKRHNKIAIFYGHHISQDYDKEYNTHYKFLLKVCKYVNDNKIEFMTMKDLVIKA